MTITNDDEHDAAIAAIDALIDKDDRTPEEEARLDSLGNDVWEYERKIYGPIPPPPDAETRARMIRISLGDEEGET